MGRIRIVRKYIERLVVLGILCLCFVACQKPEAEGSNEAEKVARQTTEENVTNKGTNKSKEESIPDDLIPGDGTQEAIEANVSPDASAGQASGGGVSASSQAASGNGTTDTTGSSGSLSNGGTENGATQGGQVNASKTTVGVSFVVESSQAEASGYSVNYSTAMELQKGSTVYDALKQSGINFSGSGYIESIGGLPEKAISATSGWKYYVNGKEPSMASQDYVLQEGDYVQWSYVLKP